MSQTSSIPTYHPHIDGLRAIAVLSVLLFHLDPSWLPGGFTGVDVFFVISGFVISGSLDNRELQGFGQFLGYFYSRRLKRILPALLVCVLLTTAMTALFTIRGIGDGRIFAETAMYSLFGFSNLILNENAQNYFAQSTELNPFTHTWSLAVEEQFYFIFPLLFFFWANAKRSVLSQRVSVGLFVAGLVASFGFAFWKTPSDPSFAFYSIFSRFWELAVGVLLYQHFAVRGMNVGGSALLRSVGALVSAALLSAGLWFADSASFPIPWVIPSVLGTAGLIVFLVNPPWSGPAQKIHRVLSSRPMVYIGHLSYSLYLWHWPVIVLAKWTVGVESAVHKVAILLLVLALTIMSYYFVEKPIRHLRPSWVKTDRWPLFAGLATIVVGVMLVSLTFRVQDQLSLSVTSDRSDWYPTGKALSDQTRCGSESLTHSLPAGTYREFKSRCGSAKTSTLFVMGDSHVWAYLPMLRTLAANHPIDVITFSKGGCLMPEALHFTEAYSADCQDFARQARRRTLELLKPGDIVFVPGFRIRALSDELATVVEDEASPVDPRLSVAQLKQLLAPYLKRSARILLEGPKPVFGAEPYRCSDWFNRGSRACEAGFEVRRARIESFSQPLLDVYESVASSSLDVAIYAPMEALCTPEKCSAFQSGRPLIYDSNHLSRFGNQVVYHSFEEQIIALLGTRLEVSLREGFREGF